ncbi:hypothetical protein FRC11_014680 [Ceratobasidium sp. 423]|nr:hypothetical protein FRC11_014680 [Ceratobasidium sp. 423]
MAFPKDGSYILRFLSNPDEQIVGGFVATEIQGQGKPINAAPENSSLQGQQIWRVTGVGKGEVEILYAPRESGDEIGRVGFHYEQDRPEAPIVLSFVSKFRLEHIKGNIWRIRPVGNLVGIDLVVGLNEERDDKTLAIIPYPIGPVPRPAWWFERVQS